MKTLKDEKKKEVTHQSNLSCTEDQSQIDPNDNFENVEIYYGAQTARPREFLNSGNVNSEYRTNGPFLRVGREKRKRFLCILAYIRYDRKITSVKLTQSMGNKVQITTGSESGNNSNSSNSECRRLVEIIITPKCNHRKIISSFERIEVDFNFNENTSSDKTFQLNSSKKRSKIRLYPKVLLKLPFQLIGYILKNIILYIDLVFGNEGSSGPTRKTQVIPPPS